MPFNDSISLFKFFLECSLTYCQTSFLNILKNSHSTFEDLVHVFSLLSSWVVPTSIFAFRERLKMLLNKVIFWGLPETRENFHSSLHSQHDVSPLTPSHC